MLREALVLQRSRLTRMWDAGAGHTFNENVWPASENTSGIVVLEKARREEDDDMALGLQRDGSRVRDVQGREVTALWLKRQTTLGPADCPRRDLTTPQQEPMPRRQKQSGVERYRRITHTRYSRLTSPRSRLQSLIHPLLLREARWTWLYVCCDDDLGVVRGMLDTVRGWVS